MSQDNKNIVRHWFAEFWGVGWNPAVVAELGTPDICVRHTMFEPQRGQAGVTRGMIALRRAFPDLRFTVVGELIAEGDYVVARWEGGGTHAGPAFADFRMGSLPEASGRTMRFEGMTVFRMERWQVADERGHHDALTAMQQLGLLHTPDPNAGAPAARVGGALPYGWNRLGAGGILRERRDR